MMGEVDEQLTSFRREGRLLPWQPFLAMGLPAVVFGFFYFVYNPLPQYKPEMWLLFLSGVSIFLYIVYQGMFAFILASVRIVLGFSDSITVHDAAIVAEQPAVYDDDGNQVHMDLQIVRVGGWTDTPWRGRNFAIFPRIPGIILELGHTIVIFADFSVKAWDDLYPWIQQKFITRGGRVVIDGFNPKRSRIYYAAQILVLDQDIERYQALSKELGVPDEIVNAAFANLRRSQRMFGRLSGRGGEEGKKVILVKEEEDELVS